MKPKEPGDKDIKPNYDARLMYIDELGAYLSDIREANKINNLQQKFIALQGFHALSAPFTSKIANTELEELFKEASSDLNKKTTTLKNNAAVPLNKLFKKLMQHSKHLLIPFDVDDQNEIDFDALRKK